MRPLRYFAISLVLCALPWTGFAQDEAPPTDPEPAAESAAAPEAASATQAKESHSIGHRLLFYIPNRLFDVFDIVRARARLAPGMAINARVTQLAALTFGGYAGVFAGLPGPRGMPRIPLPFGVEQYSGLQVSVAGTDSKSRVTPNYGKTEVGAGFQLLLVGIDLGVDPLEVLDLAAGFLLIDLTGDDF